MEHKAEEKKKRGCGSAYDGKKGHHPNNLKRRGG
jgi:hypothetical protein